ncbi:MAG: hypothetical protein ISS28_05250 [Candidatus Cloacimonetes bacterium]|nr:hypothetical protein [Candidatus Cloacimonadota bacterium]
MNPKQLAKQVCANYSNGICIGVQIEKDLSQYIDLELYNKPCCVNEKRCSYFERIILPLVEMSKEHPNLYAMKKAVTKYETKVIGLSKSLRRCKECKRPSPELKANEMFCVKCKRLRVLKSKRKYYRENKETILKKRRCHLEKVP